MEIVSNLGIMFFGGLGVYLLSRDDDWFRWGYISGMLSQPFWFYIAISTMQIGVIVMACWFTFCWGRGIYNYWIKENNNEASSYSGRAL